MKIQIISYSNKLINKFNDYDITYSTINSPKSFDEFDVNIISLQEDDIWTYHDYEIRNTVDCIEDFKSLQCIIQNSSYAKTILAFPINCNFRYNYYTSEKRYKYANELKNILVNVCKIIECIIPANIKNQWFLKYENTTTIINDNGYDASFYFDTPCQVLTDSKGSQKPTTICYSDELYFTSLNLSSSTFNLKDFLNKIGLDSSGSKVPEWLEKLNYLDDETQHRIVFENKENIIIAQEKINNAKQKLEENLKYKSILVNNGNELVSVVFDILEKILDYNLSEFKDNKKEDFLIKKDAVTFIGEIKGITSNVKSENVAQVERHYQSYMDELQENGLSENVKQLLIINPFRTKELSLRDEVHQIQINLAKKYGSLIITTETLLEIFEKFSNGEITVEKTISVFSSEIGLADIKSFI